MRIDILSLFPGMFTPILGTSIPKRAAEKGLVSYHLHDIRDVATDAHRSVDDRPFGGGPGMVMMAPILADAVDRADALDPAPATRLLMSPAGRTLDQAFVRELASKPRLMLVCGRYEGVDSRAIDALGLTELSIGDYVLSGGELAAMCVVDAVVRLLPGALGHEQGAIEESFSDGLLEHPQFTWPREFRSMGVPEVLLGGDHKKIAAWKQQQREQLTRRRRPDLWEKYETKQNRVEP
jgi:tRNA (guanine37-N1)-methyltransferase